MAGEDGGGIPGRQTLSGRPWIPNPAAPAYGRNEGQPVTLPKKKRDQACLDAVHQQPEHAGGADRARCVGEHLSDWSPCADDIEDYGRRGNCVQCVRTNPPPGSWLAMQRRDRRDRRKLSAPPLSAQPVRGFALPL